MSTAWDIAAIHLADLEPDAFAVLYRATPKRDQPDLLRKRFRWHREEFARYCWPKRFWRPYSELQLDLLSQVRAPEVYHQRTTPIREAFAAPRGSAKSTCGCFIDIVHSLAYGLEKFVAIVSAGQDLAVSRARDIRDAFNRPTDALASLYGPFLVSGGVTDYTVQIRNGPAMRIWPRSFGSQLRGELFEGVRPTFILLDDAERSDRVRSPDQRRIWKTTLKDDILKAGDKRTRTVFLGTVLHPESMLADQLKSPGWRSKKWQAVIEWPEKMELWEECGRLWKDLSREDSRLDDARAFYEENRAEMDKGAIVLDPVGLSLWDCWVEIWSEGWRSFLRELQNDPVDPTAQLFVSDTFTRCRVVLDHADGPTIITATGDKVYIAKCVRKIIRWDPAMGGVDGDFAALVAVVKDKHGYCYVVDAWVRREKPSGQIAALWRQAERAGIRRVSLESNGFQALLEASFRRDRKARKDAGKYWQVDCNTEPSVDNKQERIASMEPDIANGWIQFAEHLPAEFFLQFDRFPTGDHEDGPDALQGAWARL